MALSGGRRLPRKVSWMRAAVGTLERFESTPWARPQGAFLGATEGWSGAPIALLGGKGVRSPRPGARGSASPARARGLVWGLLRPRGNRPAPPGGHVARLVQSDPGEPIGCDQDTCAAQFDGARRRHPAAGSPRSPRPRSRTRERTEARQRQSRAKALHAEYSWTTTCLLTPYGLCQFGRAPERWSPGPKPNTRGSVAAPPAEVSSFERGSPHHNRR